MKILHVETGRHLYGGAQQVLWLVGGLVRRGIDCVLVCPPDSAISGVAQADGIVVRHLRCNGDLDVSFALRLRSLLKDSVPDLLHCHSRRGADIMGGVAGRLSGVPAVLSRRVDNVEPNWLANFRYRWYNQLIAISENVADVLREQGVNNRRIDVIRDAVDVDTVAQAPDRQLIADRFGIAADECAIAVVAQLIRRKGHRFLLDVLPGLLEHHPAIRVVFFGEGQEEQGLRELTHKLRLGRIVQFAGFRPDLDNYLGAFDLLVHPAEREGLGVALLKAAAAGLPVVAFDAGGATEAVVHGKTGVLVAPGDLESLQKAIGLLVEDRAMREDFGRAGRQRMKDKFSVESMVASHIALYERILDA